MMVSIEDLDAPLLGKSLCDVCLNVIIRQGLQFQARMVVEGVPEYVVRPARYAKFDVFVCCKIEYKVDEPFSSFFVTLKFLYRALVRTERYQYQVNCPKSRRLQLRTAQHGTSTYIETVNEEE